MDIEEFRQYCLSKKAVTEGLPFGEDTLVFKVAGKMFALTGLASEEFSVNLKCNPEHALELREQHPGDIIPGYHMSKKHWNTVYVDNITRDLLIKLIDHSYDLVVGGLTQKLKKELEDL